MTMSSTVDDCWHGRLSSKEAEMRLMVVNKSKVSEVKRNRLILSYISDKDKGLGKHLLLSTNLSRMSSSLSRCPLSTKSGSGGQGVILTR